MYTPPPDVNGINSNHTNISIDSVQQPQNWQYRNKITDQTDSPSPEIESIYQSCQEKLDESFHNFSEKELIKEFKIAPESETVNRTDSVFESAITHLKEGLESGITNSKEEDIFGDSIEEKIFGGDNTDNIFGDDSNIAITYDEEDQQEILNIDEEKKSIEDLLKGDLQKRLTIEEEKVVYTQAQQVNITTQQLNNEVVEFHEIEKPKLEQLKDLNVLSLYTQGYTKALDKELNQRGITLKDPGFFQTELTKELGPSPKLQSEEESSALGKRLVVKGVKNKLFRKNGRLLTKNEAKELIASFDQNFREFYQKKIKPLYLLQQKELKDKKKIEQEESQSRPTTLPNTEEIKPKQVFVSHLVDEMPFVTKMEKILARKLDEASALAKRLKEEKIEREEINYMRLRHEIISKEINHAEINKNDQQRQNFKIDNFSRRKMAESLKKPIIEMKAKS